MMPHAEGHGDFRIHKGQSGGGRSYWLYVEAGKLPYRALAWGPSIGELWVGYGSMRLRNWRPGWYVLDFEREPGIEMKLLVHIREQRAA